MLGHPAIRNPQPASLKLTTEDRCSVTPQKSPHHLTHPHKPHRNIRHITGAQCRAITHNQEVSEMRTLQKTLFIIALLTLLMFTSLLVERLDSTRTKLWRTGAAMGASHAPRVITAFRIRQSATPCG